MYALTGVNSFSGTASVSSGTLQGSSTSLTGPVALANNSTVAFNQASNGVYTQSISGNGSLVKTGNGVLTLQGANTYTGTTYINAGSLQIGAAGRIAGRLVRQRLRHDRPLQRFGATICAA